jgi:hypothetical protein
MNFWKALRWIGALLFVALVLLAWLVAGPKTSEDDGTYAAPVIVR